MINSADGITSSVCGVFFIVAVSTGFKIKKLSTTINSLNSL